MTRKPAKARTTPAPRRRPGDDPQHGRALLRCRLLTRLTEDRLVRLYHQGRISGGVYTSRGQEAIGAATAAAGGPDDLYAPLIRDMTVHIGRGEPVLDIFRHYLGRVTGPMKGRDGNVHYGCLARGVYPMISHLGAMLPVVTGAVLARRRQGRPTVGFAYLGDGATSTGDFHEAVNFAAVFDAPVIFVIENNQFAYSTPTARQFRCANLADRAAGYGIEGLAADGNEALDLFQLTRGLVERLRARPRPVLLVCDTMRMRGHGEHDDFAYVPRDLLARYAARDPLDLARARLSAAGALTAAAAARLEQECLAEVDAACQQALAEPPPDPATLTEGVYAAD
ncbi:MAG: thiamine pyrophosphate-dependent dehydrogenase E1 component subunit alpha [Kiritimatiellaeota bacterium]|nr:thiamine pyrophosphate-dependent dehydrogenase E1 component subunit alpha [Kiritimatiellota bacterium]